MSDYLEAGVFGEVEGFGDSADGVAPVGVPGDVFVDGLDADFEAGAAVAKHLAGRLVNERGIDKKG